MVPVQNTKRKAVISLARLKYILLGLVPGEILAKLPFVTSKIWFWGSSPKSWLAPVNRAYPSLSELPSKMSPSIVPDATFVDPLAETENVIVAALLVVVLDVVELVVVALVVVELVVVVLLEVVLLEVVLLEVVLLVVVDLVVVELVVVMRVEEGLVVVVDLVVCLAVVVVVVVGQIFCL